LEFQAFSLIASPVSCTSRVAECIFQADRPSLVAGGGIFGAAAFFELFGTALDRHFRLRY